MSHDRGVHIAWTSFLLALVVVTVVPGPDFVLVTGNAVRGVRYGAVTALGVVTGLLVRPAGHPRPPRWWPRPGRAAGGEGRRGLPGVPGFATLRAARRGGPIRRAATSDRSLFLRGLQATCLNPKVMLIFSASCRRPWTRPHRLCPGRAPVRVAVTLRCFWAVVVPRHPPRPPACPPARAPVLQPPCGTPDHHGCHRPTT
ncbi:LysE family translocator [Saccharothrix sp. MB29]|nr:LysE family translocator [Saccharothrix sp. MB29]